MYILRTSMFCPCFAVPSKTSGPLKFPRRVCFYIVFCSLQRARCSIAINNINHYYGYGHCETNRCVLSIVFCMTVIRFLNLFKNNMWTKPCVVQQQPQRFKSIGHYVTPTDMCYVPPINIIITLVGIKILTTLS